MALSYPTEGGLLILHRITLLIMALGSVAVSAALAAGDPDLQDRPKAGSVADFLRFIKENPSAKQEALRRLKAMGDNAIPELAREIKVNPYAAFALMELRPEPNEARIAEAVRLLANGNDSIEAYPKEWFPETPVKYLAGCGSPGLQATLNCLRAMAPKADSEAVPIGVLISVDGSTPVLLIGVLGRFGPQAREAIPTLLLFLKYRPEYANRPVYASYAQKALIDIGADCCEPYLVEIAETKAGFPVLEAFGERAVPALIQCLQNADRQVRVSACESLGRLGPRGAKAVAALVSLARAEATDQLAALAAQRALSEIDPEALRRARWEQHVRPWLVWGGMAVVLATTVAVLIVLVRRRRLKSAEPDADATR
jgi:hypothetical protein